MARDETTPSEIRYRTPANRKKAVRQALDALRGSRRAVLTTHLNADGDGAGCQIAMAAWMRSLGARPHIVNPTPFPDMFRFLLPDTDGLILEASSAEARAA